MDTLTIIIIGALQGILEWIPISSQGIITTILTLLGYTPNDAMNYAIFLHGGTMLAALIYYRREFKQMLTNGKLLSFTLTVTILTLMIGAPIYILLDKISETGGLILLAFIGSALIITGILQVKTKKTGKKKEPGKMDAIITGIAQGFSVVPGISRSGMTISTLLFRRFNGESAIKLSFMLSVPAVLIAEIGLQVIKGSTYAIDGVYGLIAAFIVGLAGIRIMTAVTRKVNFAKFCILIGMLMTISAILRMF